MGVPVNKYRLGMVKIIAIGFLLGASVACTSSPQTQANARIKDSLTNEINGIYQQGQFNGFAVAIVNANGTLYQQGFGFADVKAARPYTQNTIQNIASISKTFVGIALLKAQEMGKLQLDDPINKYLPFKVENPYYPTAAITIRQLATHTSTIVDNEFYFSKDYYLKPNQDLTGLKLVFDDTQVFNPYDSIVPLGTFLQHMLTTTGKWYKKEGFLQKQPGEQYEYSNTATTLAAYIIEQATGIPFNQFTATYILKPLQMDASGWRFEDVDFSNYSHLYENPKAELPFYSMISYPDGNFITSIHDLSKYLTELIKGYEGNGTILTKESYSEFYKQQLNSRHFIERNESNPYNESFNVGIFIGFGYTGYIGHTGGDPGVCSIMFFDPVTKTGRLLVINTSINNKAGNDAFYGIWNKLEKYQSRL